MGVARREQMADMWGIEAPPEEPDPHGSERRRLRRFRRQAVGPNDVRDAVARLSYVAIARIALAQLRTHLAGVFAIPDLFVRLDEFGEFSPSETFKTFVTLFPDEV